MQNKNPQGNFDPIPDSDQELEKYGVWVKAEPQDVVEEPATEHKALIAEYDSSFEPLEELSDEIEELEEMQALDEADTETFDDLAPLDDGIAPLDDDLDPLDDKKASIMNVDTEAPESIDLSDFGLDELDTKTENEQTYEEIDMELDLDEELSADGDSEAALSFDFDDPMDSASAKDLTFDEETSEQSEELLPQIEFENIEIEEDSPAPPFDDVGALEEDLASSSPSANSVPNDLLQKIALELSSIKQELVSLRNQLGELKREPVPGRSEEEELEDEAAKGGFFDDEDDDTIALTGDELDNILNTADFTVEPPVDLTTPESLDEPDIFGTTVIPEEPEAPAVDWKMETQDLLPEDGSYLTTGAAEATEPEEPEEAGIQAIESEEAFDMNFGNEEELSPLELIPEIKVITESPEDTSYLDEDASEPTDDFELIASPLEDVPLVEPDLTELDLDLEIDDAIAAESAEDLPFMESADEDEAELIIDEDSGVSSITAASEDGQTTLEDDDFDGILDLDEADEELILSIDGDEQLPSFGTEDSTGAIDEIEDAEPLSMDPFQDETVAELELHKEGPVQADGSWAFEPETTPEATLVEEFGELESFVVEGSAEEDIEESLNDFGSLELGDSGLLGSQEIEDLGGEELEDLDGEILEELVSEDLEVLNEEVLDGLDSVDEVETIDDFEEMEELSELEEPDIGSMAEEPDIGSMAEEPGIAEEELQVVTPESVPAIDRSEIPEELEAAETSEAVPDKLKQDVKSVLLYLDQLLASLPEEKIEEFASSEYYDTYKKLFEDLGLL